MKYGKIIKREETIYSIQSAEGHYQRTVEIVEKKITRMRRNFFEKVKLINVVA